MTSIQSQGIPCLCERRLKPANWPPTLHPSRAEGLVQWLKLPAWKIDNSGFEPYSGILVSEKKTKCSLPAHSLIFSIYVANLCDRAIVCSASDRHRSNFELCVGRAMSSYSFHHLQKVLLAPLSLNVHKSGLNPIHLILFTPLPTTTSS